MDTQGKQDKLHPRKPVPRGGSAIGVPKGDAVGGRKKNSAYAVPHAHKENVSSTAGSFPSQQPSVARGKQQVPRQPLVPYDQNDSQDQDSGQNFPYGPGVQGGFGRLAG